MEHLLTQVQDLFLGVITNLTNPEHWQHLLSRPDVTLAAFIVLNLIVFTETGLFVGFFLPGDSLLVTAGIVCYLSGWSLPLLMGTLCLSAIVGDSVGYWIGYKTGPKLFQREDSWFFHRKHILAAQDFYHRHGGKTIIIARFIPIIRTFAPVVAGIGKMEYKRFLAYNIVGGIAWVISMIGLGYLLPMALNEPLKAWFGPQFRIEKHIDKVIVIVVLLSISPGLWSVGKRLIRSPAEQPQQAMKPAA